MAKPTTRDFRESLKIAISEVLSKVPPMTTIKQEQELAVVELFFFQQDLAKGLSYPHQNPFLSCFPLVEPMDEQRKEASRFGITAMRLDIHMDTEIQEGRWSLCSGPGAE